MGGMQSQAQYVLRTVEERGVRFVNIYHEGWDAHSDVIGNLKKNCGETDQASAALVKDLKQRGLLDETLVIWGGEFGRTPVNEGRGGVKFLGRDHHPKAFTVWLAGGSTGGSEGLNSFSRSSLRGWPAASAFW